VAYSGEIDPQKQSADLMEAAMAKEGLKLERLIGPNTAHKYHPDSAKQLTARLEALADHGRTATPAELRVTTYTLRYPGESWAKFAGLEQHWERADLVAKRTGPDAVTLTTKGTTAVSLTLPGLREATVDGQKLTFAKTGDAGIVLRRADGRWTTAPFDAALRKRPQLTGPIDDAFMEAFKFVRPTGHRLNATVGRWVDAELAAARKLWRDIFRGEAPVVDDVAVTDDDIATKNLIVWGDPKSNRFLARILGQLPLQWDGKSLVFRGRTYDADHHAPVLIFPNPLNPSHYIVLNSGIDFRDEAYGTNSLQVPKLPDYAIVDLREKAGPRWPGKIVDAGFFNEAWK
jgi:hypothetical protein